MNLLKSFIVWAVLLVMLYVTWQVVSADGWLAGGVFLLVSVFFVSLVTGIAGTLLALFSPRRTD